MGVVVGCGGSPADRGADGSTAPRAVELAALPAPLADACAAYKDKPDVLGWCVRGAVEDLPSAADAVKACAAAGHWAARCRQAWVDRRLSDPTVALDTLLGVCGDAADCAFRILDARPSTDIAEQIGRCRLHASRYEVDCARHALQRWVAGQPGAEALRAACAISFPDVDDAGSWLAWPVACRGVGSCCDAPASLASACQQGVAELRSDPGRCRAGLRAPTSGAAVPPAPAVRP